MARATRLSLYAVLSPALLKLGAAVGRGAVHERSLDKDTDAAEDIDPFEKFIKHYDRSYLSNSDEYHHRRELFNRRLRQVEEHNSRPDRLWTAAVNTFADYTEDERSQLRGWRDLHRGSRGHGQAASYGHASSFIETQRRVYPQTVSWANLSSAKNFVDQGSCGSCWAVATVSTLEAHYEITQQATRSFSTQELVDCVPNPRHCGGKGGCDGATVELAMHWALHGGLETAEANRYEAQDKSCSKADAFEAAKAAPHHLSALDEDGRLAVSFFADDADGKALSGHAFGLHGFLTLEKNKEEPLVAALVDQGPVAVSVGAAGWYDYDKGVFDGCKSDAVIDHAVTLYGYGSDQGSKYWLIRNSWGGEWGERGFIRLIRHDDEESHCGYDEQPGQGVACDGAPAKVRVCGTCGILYDAVVPKFKSTKQSLFRRESPEARIQQRSSKTAVVKDKKSAHISLGIEHNAVPVLFNEPVRSIRTETRS